MSILRKFLGLNAKTEVLSGLTVALALVPEAVAFAFIAGVHPLTGLYAAFIVCLITAIFGGRPGMISGATGALAVVMVNLVVQHGVEYLFATVILMGVIQLLAGFLKLGRFISMVPYPVMLGFVNGLAIVIFLSQIQHFKVTIPGESTQWMTGSALWIMISLVVLTMAITKFLPKITKAIPSALAAILMVSSVVVFFEIPTPAVHNLASISGSLPSFHIPSVAINTDSLSIIFPYALILAAIGLIESLLTLTLVDQLTETPSKNSRECLAQGLANVAAGFFSSMGGCAMIGQSIINIRSGARGRLSGIAAAAFLLSFVLFASKFIEMIPLGALVGVMFVVAVSTFEWVSFRILNKIPKTDAFVLLVVTGVTVMSNLAVAVIVGVIVSALVFAWNNAKHIRADSHKGDDAIKVYKVHGPLFFASVGSFRGLFNPKNDPKEVIIDFQNSRVWDHSGIDAIESLAERYYNNNRKLHLKHLSKDCSRLLKKASNFIDRNESEDPLYRVIARDS